MTTVSIFQQVERACAQLRRDGHDVTFTAVAAATGHGRMKRHGFDAASF